MTDHSLDDFWKAYGKEVIIVEDHVKEVQHVSFGNSGHNYMATRHEEIVPLRLVMHDGKYYMLNHTTDHSHVYLRFARPSEIDGTDRVFQHIPRG